MSRAAREEITGDNFSVELIMGAYDGYTRGGYIARAATSSRVAEASGLDHQHRGFRCQVGVGVQHTKLIKTRLPKLHIGGELARLIGLGG